MGEFFGEEDRRVEKKEVKLIENPQELVASYNILSSKIELITGEAYEAIAPLRTELLGVEDNPEMTGQIGHLRRSLEMSRISRMPIATLMKGSLKNMVDLDLWTGRYTDYLEKFLDNLKMIAESSFKIMNNLYKEIDALKKEIRELHQEKRMSAYRQEMKPQDKTQPQEKKTPEQKYEENKVDIFKEMFDEKLEHYRSARLSGDPKLIDVTVRHLYAICGKDKEKKKIVEKEMEFIENSLAEGGKF